MRTEEEIREKLRDLNHEDGGDHLVGLKDGLRWVLEEGPGYDGYDHI